MTADPAADGPDAAASPPPPAHPGPAAPKVVAGFFSFTEVEAGAHRSYNEWHLFDHLPEQFVLAGIAGGWRWVRTPALASAATSTATPPLDRTHYVTLYLLAEPLTQALSDFQEHGVALARAGRFHQQRTSHLAGPLLVEAQCAVPRMVVAPAAVPFRPGTGLHVRVLPAALDLEAACPAALLQVPGVAGVWSFSGVPPAAPGPFGGALAGRRVVCAWLDGDPAEVDAALAATCPAPPVPGDGPSGFVGTLAAIDPAGPFDWFDR